MSPSWSHPAARFLLACALPADRVGPGTLAGLAGQIEDWDALSARALHALAEPLVQARLAELGALVPDPARQRIDRLAAASAARNLRLSALLTSLHDTWFVPNGISYVAVKGVTLAQRYYGTISRRTCRDLDLLVDPASCAKTILHLVDAGFRPCRGFELPDEPGKREVHVSAMCDLNDEISLRSPAGDLVDVHTALDLTGADFPTSRLLAKTEAVSILGRSIPCLPTEELFVFLCYHHSRHHWTRLHWVADIGRIASAPDFDCARVLAAARRNGMEGLVQACLGMLEELALAVHGTAPAGDGLAATMARQCLTHLDPEAEAPMETYVRGIHDWRFRWRHWFVLTGEEWRYRRGFARKLRSLLRSSTPSWEVYRAMPLPRGLRWLYVPMRTAMHLLRHVPRW
ncbi:nucleotidyltransferase family protein [Novosphingobium sp. TH158]|uniref:nucleotidyltransferase family protein n=1 Tax=Novosphingobium sp. TH158 TaxID=2067455 RepID=UPI001303F80A|nr:nucleotidyltransferase family protein [Novosphingobium sp. TH158]